MTKKVNNIFNYKGCETYYKQLKIRFSTDLECDKILNKLKIQRDKDVKIRYEKISKECQECNYVDLSGLPEFRLEQSNPEFTIRFNDEDDLKEFYTDILEKPFKKEKGIWFPNRHLVYPPKSYWKSKKTDMINKYPLFVISKGRFSKDRSLTHNYFSQNKIKHFIVVEECEYKDYFENMSDEYTTILQMEKENNNLNQGSIPVRNWIDNYSREKGHKKYWCIDDNIDGFYFFDRNCRREVKDTTSFRILEDLSDRYKNLYLSGMNYLSFVPEIIRNKPSCVRNTRIYSCILISTELKDILDGVLWRGVFNEDTDLSLRVLKKGLPTILSNQYLCNKSTTLSVKGGNTSSIYTGDGLQKKLDSLIQQHPDVVKGTIKFKKVHHQVDYKPFKNNKLEYVSEYKPSKKHDDYGLTNYITITE